MMKVIILLYYFSEIISHKFDSCNRDNDRCFSCRQFGHFGKDCPEKDTSLDIVSGREDHIPKYKTKGAPLSMKVTQRKMKKLWQQCVTMVKLSSVQVNREDN